MGDTHPDHADDTPAERTVTLPGGRCLAYAEYGDPSGQPVLYFHGMPGSHIEARAFEAAATAGGERIIAVDRPGMGASPPAPRQRVLDWASDVTTLADHLCLNRFAVIGVSGGGPYALACAHAVPDRLTGIALISSVGPLDGVPADGLDEAERRHYQGLLTLRRFPLLARIVAAQTARRVRKPGGALKLVTESMSPTDRARVDTSPQLAVELQASITAAFRHGSTGFATDLRLLFTRPWGFALADVPIPVHLWHGDCDHNVPIADGRRLAATLPDCRATFLPGAGHLLFLDHAGDILTALAPQP